jgi:hypothetical protein
MIAGSFAALRFSSLAATRLGTTHLDGAGEEDLDVALTAGEDALEAALTAGDAARDAPLAAGDGSRCLDGAGDENRRFTVDAAAAAPLPPPPSHLAVSTKATWPWPRAP